MTATPATPARMQSAAFVASTPPIATTGIETARQISPSPSRPIGSVASGFDRFGDVRRREAEQKPFGDGALRPLVTAPEMDAIRVQPQRRLHVVVDDEER